MFPVAEWLDAPTLRGISTYLREGPLVRDGWVRPEAISELVSEHATRRGDHHVRLWQLVSLDSWHRGYLGAVSPQEQTDLLIHSLGISMPDREPS
jgi:hypothetical protein